MRNKMITLSWYWTCRTETCSRAGRAVDGAGAIRAAVDHAVRKHHTAEYEIQHRRWYGRWVRVLTDIIATRTPPASSASADVSEWRTAA